MNPSQILLLSIFLFSSIIHITLGITCWDGEGGVQVCDSFMTLCVRTKVGETGLSYSCESGACKDQMAAPDINAANPLDNRKPLPKCTDVAFYEECCCEGADECNKKTKSGGERGKLTCKKGEKKKKTSGLNISLKEPFKDEKECKACGREITSDKIILKCFKRNLCGDGEANGYPKNPDKCKEKTDGTSKCCCEENMCLDAPKEEPAKPTPQPTKPQPKTDPKPKTEPKTDPPSGGKPGDDDEEKPKPGDDDEEKTGDDDKEKAGDDDQSKTSTSSSDEDGSATKSGSGMFPRIGVLALALSLSLGGILVLHENLQ